MRTSSDEGRWAALAALLLVAMASAVTAQPIEVGQAAPDFSLTTLDGGEAVLAARVAEGPVVLVFFRGAW